MEKLREQYEKEVIPALMKKFNYKSVMQVPKLDKDSYKYWFRRYKRKS